MSSAILLAAIVVLWACALIPRWLRRAHDAAPDHARETFETEEAYPADRPDGDQGPYHPEQPYHSGQACDPAYADEQAYYPDQPYGGEPAYYPGRAYAGEPAYDRGQAYAGGPTYDPEQAYAAESAYDPEQAYAGEPAYDPEQAYAGEPANANEPDDADRRGTRLPDRPPAPALRGAPGGRPPALRSDTAGRGRVLRARRRTLTMLALLVIAAGGCRVLGLAHSWVVIPPALMLGMYLLVLRAAVHADAENTARRAAAHAQAVERSRAVAAAMSARAAAAARARAREAAQAAPRPTAEVIDIGARAVATDQLYDQYLDATARAIGD